jgi:hypothetical protein
MFRCSPLWLTWARALPAANAKVNVSMTERGGIFELRRFIEILFLFMEVSFTGLGSLVS